jgi:hypothetical protein
MTIAAGVIGTTLVVSGFVTWRLNDDLGIAAFMGVVGAALFGAAAWDLVTTFA